VSRRHCVSMAAANIDRDVLPDNIKPSNYNLQIHDIELGGAFKYSGTVSILSNVIKSTREVILNSHECLYNHPQLKSVHNGRLCDILKARLVDLASGVLPKHQALNAGDLVWFPCLILICITMSEPVGVAQQYSKFFSILLS